MPQQVRRRQQKTIQFEANSKVSESLSRGMVYREVFLRLKWTATCQATLNTQAATEKGDEWAVVDKIEIIANNTDVIKSISGNQLWWLNYMLYGVAPPIDMDIGDEGSNPAVDVTLVLPFWMPRSIKPLDTALDARQLSDLKIEVTWKNYTDINANYTAFSTEPTLQVHSLESFNVKGTFSQWRVYVIEKTFSATNTQEQITLPVGPVYRGFLINTDDDGADADGDILNNFKIKSGTTVFADIPGQLLQHVDGWTRNSINHSYDHAGDAYDSPRRGADNDITGWYWYDHVTDGRLTEGIDTLGYSEFELELNVTHQATTSKLFILPMQIIPVRQQ